MNSQEYIECWRQFAAAALTGIASRPFDERGSEDEMTDEASSLASAMIDRANDFEIIAQCMADEDGAQAKKINP